MGRKTKKRGDWLSRSQLEVLAGIRALGRSGLDLWGGEVNLATLRSLSKRRLVDTRRGGRVVITRAGKRRLRGPWPAEDARRDRARASGSGSDDER